MPTDELRRLQFAECIDSEAASLFRVAYRLLGCRNAAADLVQEAFLQAWQSLDRLQDTKKLRGWLFAILRNQHLKQLRNDKRMVIMSPAAIEQSIQATPMDRTETSDLVQFAMEQLDREQKLPILLMTMEGWTAAETAELLQIPLGTVLSRCHRGKERLRSILGKQLNFQQETTRHD